MDVSDGGADGAQHRGLSRRSAVSVRDLSVVKHRVFADPRGALVPMELTTTVPFPVARLFWVFDVAAGQQRGAHAHRTCSQYMICVSGLVRIEVQDGADLCAFDLNPGEALHVPPMIWATEQYKVEATILLVLCDKPYEADDYIHSIADFRELRSGTL